MTPPWKESRLYLTNMMRTYLYPCSVLIKASHCYTGRSVLHPLSRKATVHVSFRNTRGNSKLHSWPSRFTNSLNLERMIISVWSRSRNVSLIDYWKSSACYSHGKEMFDGNILCSFVYPYIIVEISRTLRSWCNYLQSALKEGSAKHVIEGLLEHNFESLKSHYDKSYLIHRLISINLSPVQQQWEWTQTSPRHSFVPWKWTVKLIYCLHSRAEIGYEYFVKMAEV